MFFTKLDQFPKYFSKHYDIRQAGDFVEQNLTGWDIIEYSLEAGEQNGINDPDYLKKVDTFAQWYRSQPKVAYVKACFTAPFQLNSKMLAPVKRAISRGATRSSTF